MMAITATVTFIMIAALISSLRREMERECLEEKWNHLGTA
jgi:hypothetical protein